MARLRRGPLPFPGLAIVGGGGALSRLRRAKKRRGLDRAPPPRKHKPSEKGEWELGRGVCRLRQAKGNETYGFFPFGNPFFPRLSLDRGGVLIEDRGENA
jgi:hypothetical protein